MRTTRQLSILVLLLVPLLAPESASAWARDGGPAYRSGAVRFWVAPMTPPARAQVVHAIRAWNRAGARMRLTPSTRSRAQIIVRAPRGRTCSGFATSTWRNGRRGRSVVTWSRCADRWDAARLVAHELGHALGLDHERRRCAVMNSIDAAIPASSCWNPARLKTWQYYCRVLEADDARGLVARYGGTARLPAGRRVCQRGPAPAPVADLAITSTIDSATVTWTNPEGSSADIVLVTWGSGSCPSSWQDPARIKVDEVAATPGPASATFNGAVAGTLCALVQAHDRWGRPSPARTATPPAE